MKSLHDLLPKYCLFEYRIDYYKNTFTIGIVDTRDSRKCMMDFEIFYLGANKVITPERMEDWVHYYIISLINAGVICQPEN